MRRVLFSILLLGIVLLMGGTVFAGDGDSTPLDIRIVITPLQGDPGTVISVSGTGADPALDVVISIAPQADTADGSLATVTVSPAADGTFSATITMPATATDGRYAVRAEQFNDAGSVQQYYWNAFTVGNGGGGDLLPVTGTLPGTPLTVTAALALLLAASMVVRGIYGVITRKQG